MLIASLKHGGTGETSQRQGTQWYRKGDLWSYKPGQKGEGRWK